MPDFEAIGDAATGGLLGRAVEPSAGEAKGHTQERKCLNCSCELVGAYCHCCGQQAHVHRTLGAFFHDLLHGVLHFEGKIWRTLPMLAWRPGELTRRYVEGQRASFVSPVALFLFSVFTMFAVINLVGGPFDFLTTTPQARAEAGREYAKAHADNLGELKDLQARREQLARQGQPTIEVDRSISRLRRAMEMEAAVFEGLGVPTAVESEASETGNQISSTVATAGDAVTPNWFNDAYIKAKENPKLLLYKVQSNAYKFSWALIPISVPLVWLLFLNRRRYRQYHAYDHTVFVTYSLAFMTLGFIVLSLLRPIGLPGSVTGWAIAVVPPLHMYRQLRGAYLLGRFSALWRTAALLFFAMVSASVFMTILLLLGVVG